MFAGVVDQSAKVYVHDLRGRCVIVPRRRGRDPLVAKGGKFLENVRASGVCGDGGGGRNLSEICLSEEKFACEEFAYVSNEIPAWANSALRRARHGHESDAQCDDGTAERDDGGRRRAIPPEDLGAQAVDEGRLVQAEAEAHATARPRPQSPQGKRARGELRGQRPLLGRRGRRFEQRGARAT